ncbi:MAG: hypothetical protein HYX50_03955 [Chloroflexi bacterium]|nr:hypothetical protein [Chloroflexota bacterium]
MMRRRGFRFVAVLLAGIAAAGLAVGVVAARSLFDDGENHVVNPAEITPLPFYGYPATIEVPDYSNPPKCQYPADERPSPDPPPLSCRNTGAEPTPAPSPPPLRRRAPTSPVPRLARGPGAGGPC